MSYSEVFHRAIRHIGTRLQALGVMLANRPDPCIQGRRLDAWVRFEIADHRQLYESAAQDVAFGRTNLFGLAAARNDDSSPDWNRDPLTGTLAKFRFGKLIDYRDERLVGNIKYVWEPNRHLGLVTLAQAYVVSFDDRFLDRINGWLNSWLEQCPYPNGVNWASSLELSIRVINWSLTWQIIGQVDSPLFTGDTGTHLRDRWLQSIYQHAHFIHHYYSRHSSANNHLIGEAAGVFIASRTWPFWREFEKWGEQARRILIEEAAAQTHPDGVNREQAIGYQQFVLDFLILAALAGRAGGSEFPAEYWHTIERMMEFIHSVMDASGNVPMIGDADDGYVVRLSQEPGFCPYRSLLATGAVLFGRPDFAAKSGHLDDKTRMLVGSQNWDDLMRRGYELSAAPRREYPDGGYYILGNDLELSNEVRLIVDAGSLGHLSIAAHGHADALAVVLSIAGREILIDPGTYAYHTKPVWRRYFRGTGAHNTVRVDSLDQSVQAGNFMWVRHARARCLMFQPTSDGGMFAGEHDGYRRLQDPVTHQREIRMQSNVIAVTDRLLCNGIHEVERCWHFSEFCRVTHDGNGVVAEHGPVRVTLRAAESFREVRMLRGSEDPPGGWVSRHFDVKVPSHSIYFMNDIRGNCELTTLIQWETSVQDVADEN